MEKDLAKKPPPKINEMDKQQLINAMAREHSIVSLPVGTVKANSKRAAVIATTDTKKQQQQQQEVATCILDIVEHARVTKRHAQEFLGAFIEAVFERGVTEDDRSILSSLCPAVESRIRVVSQASSSTYASSGGTDKETDDSDEENNDSDKENNDSDKENNGSDDPDSEPSDAERPFIAFYQSLLAYIYSRKATSRKGKVGKLLDCATTLGIALPPVASRTVSYPTKELLESTAKQLYQSIKKMYCNGSIAFEKKVMRICQP